MNVLKTQLVVACLLFAIVVQSVSAQPTFQVYSPDAVYAGDYYADQDTWFVNTSPFELWAIGAFHVNTDFLTDVSLLFSVPDNETGTITVTALDPLNDGVPVKVGEYETTSFFPANFNNHYPLKDDVSDFIVFDIGAFTDVGELILDYNADNDGSATPTNTTGQFKEYQVSVSGYTWVHADMYGLEIKGVDSTWRASWEMNPASHDTTWIPAPGSIFLGSIGVCLVSWLRRRRTL